MRSPKSRSRGKSNRNRSAGSNVNRVFDSSGPEGKVRGTPQQIIDKYLQLTRDAQLSNDLVGAENFQQHAEHYIRLLGDAQREAEAKRAEQEAQQQRQRQAQRENDGSDRQQDHQGERQEDRQQDDRPRKERRQHKDRRPDQYSQPGEHESSEVVHAVEPDHRSSTDVVDESGSEESTLVETPESTPKPRRARKPRVQKEKSGVAEGGEGSENAGVAEANPGPPDAAE